MTTQLERCFLLNVAFYFQRIDDLIVLSFVNHKCNVFDLFLKNPSFNEEKDFTKCLKLMDNLQTFEAPLKELSKLHEHHFNKVQRYISYCEELDNNVFSYLKFIKSSLVELKLIVTEEVNFHFGGFDNLKKLYLIIGYEMQRIDFDFNDLSNDCRICIETIQYNTTFILSTVKTIKGSLTLHFSDRLDELTLAKYRSIKRDIKFVAKINNLYVSLIKAIAVLYPLNYHLPFSVDFVSSDNFSNVFNKYQIPFITLFPSQIDHDSLLIDLREEELYSLRIPPFKFPVIELLLPSALLSLSIESPLVKLPLLPNLLEFVLFNFQQNVLPQLPISLTVLSVVDCPNLSQLEVPPYIQNLCFRSLPSLRKLNSLPDTLKYCFIEHCDIDIPLLLDVRDLHLSYCGSIKPLPDSITRLFLSNIPSEIPSISHLTNLKELTLYSIDSFVDPPKSLTKITFKLCPQLQFPFPIRTVSIPFACTIPDLPSTLNLSIYLNTITSIPSMITSLQLNSCTINETTQLPQFECLAELSMTRCILKQPFPIVSSLTFLNCNQTEPIPLADSIKELILSSLGLETLIIPSSTTSMKLFNLTFLSNIRFNEKVCDISIQYCKNLLPLELPLRITELVVVGCSQFYPTNGKELKQIPYGEQLYFQNYETPKKGGFELL